MGICMPRKKPYMFERYELKLVVFVFYGRFHELLPIVFGFKGEFNDLNTRYLFKSYDQKLVVFVIMAIFMSYHSFLVLVGFARPIRYVACLRYMTKNS